MKRKAKKARGWWLHVHRDSEGFEAVDIEHVDGKRITETSPPGVPLSPCDEGQEHEWCKGWVLVREVKK